MRKRYSLLTALLVVVFLAAESAIAQNGYDLTWWTVDGGGGASSEGSYTLSGTIGQPDDGTISGGQYANSCI